MNQITHSERNLEKTTRHSKICLQISVFNAIDLNSFYKAMDKFKFPLYLITLMKLKLSQVKCIVWVQGEMSHSFTIEAGLYRGDPLSTVVINIAVEKAVR